jgi:NADH:ubiquinone oxidoreductase subunit C
MEKILKKLKSNFKNDVLEIFQPSKKRVFVKIKNESLLNIVRFLHKDMGLRFIIASGSDLKEGFEIIYHFSDDSTGGIINLRVLLPHNNPEIESLTQVFEGAEWIEREIWELLGINFKNHPNLKRLLLPEELEGKYPLRKGPNYE